MEYRGAGSKSRNLLNTFNRCQRCKFQRRENSKYTPIVASKRHQWIHIVVVERWEIWVQGTRDPCTSLLLRYMGCSVAGPQKDRSFVSAPGRSCVCSFSLVRRHHYSYSCCLLPLLQFHPPHFIHPSVRARSRIRSCQPLLPGYACWAFVWVLYTPPHVLTDSMRTHGDSPWVSMESMRTVWRLHGF